MRGLSRRLIDRVAAILEARQSLLVGKWTYPGLAEEIGELIPRRFPETMTLEKLEDIPRYLKAKAIRAERASFDPGKDRRKADRLAPYAERLREGRRAWSQETRTESGQRREVWEAFRWMVEEYRVSVFAPELGTAESVSPKKLDRLWESVRTD